MRLLPSLSVVLLLTALSSALSAPSAAPYQFYGNSRYSGCGDISSEKDEFSWSRLEYRPRMGSYEGGFGFGYGGGYSSWSRDYPKADRQFLLAMKRLTRIDSRTTQQVVDLDCPDPRYDIFNYPWVYAVQVQSWTFTEAEAKTMREFLLKGGFLMVDDFHGTEDWENFMRGMRMVFPDRPVEDLQDKDEIFHVLYDMDDRFQVPGEQYIETGRTYEKDGYVPKWRGIRDDKGRIVVAICHNMHLGDAWEWSDSPEYPEKFSAMAFRVGLNYIVYGMTH